MKDDLPRRLRQKVVRTDNNGQSYFVSRNIDGDEAAGEIERLIAELAALRENSLAVLTRVRAYRDKVITERDALRAELAAARNEHENLILMWRNETAEIEKALTVAEAERNALRAELAVERERADAHYRVLELVSAKRDELRADLRDELERADAWHKTFLQTQKHNEELRGLLREARPYVSHHGSERTNELLARIDAALKGDGDE